MTLMHDPQPPTPNPQPPLRSSDAPLLRSSNLHRRFQLGDETLHVLRGVDVSVAAGQWVAVLGASGSGKSTLLHLLGGLDRPDEGEVVYADASIYDLGARALDRYRSRSVGFVFQFYHLLPELTAIENVLIAAMIRHSWLSWPGARQATKQRAAALLERFGLEHRLHQPSTKLSGGERQRVAIARAMINQPDVLLLDEPTGNLDAQTGGEILDVFREIHAAGQTIVMVTHDANVAAAADRRLRLTDGRLG